MHNVTIIYTRQGPKFLDSSRADHTIDYATCGELMFEKIQQCATSNITHRDFRGLVEVCSTPVDRTVRLRAASKVPKFGYFSHACHS